jgi:hypothetical protein
MLDKPIRDEQKTKQQNNKKMKVKKMCKVLLNYDTSRYKASIYHP